MAKPTLALALSDIPAHGVKAGQVMEAEAATIKALQEAGWLDTAKAAIEHARSTGAQQVRSSIELAAEQEAQAADAIRVEIAKLEDLVAKNEDPGTKAALEASLAQQRQALEELLGS